MSVELEANYCPRQMLWYFMVFIGTSQELVWHFMVFIGTSQELPRNFPGYLLTKAWQIIENPHKTMVFLRFDPFFTRPGVFPGLPRTSQEG